jgi:hypothetical protein
MKQTKGKRTRIKLRNKRKETKEGQSKISRHLNAKILYSTEYNQLNWRNGHKILKKVYSLINKFIYLFIYLTNGFSLAWIQCQDDYK